MDPARSIARSDTFFPNLVDALWLGDVHHPAVLKDFAVEDVKHLHVESPQARVFMKSTVLPAAVLQYGVQQHAPAGVGSATLGLGMDPAVMRAQMQALAQFNLNVQTEAPTVEHRVDLHAELERLGLSGLPHEAVVL